MAVIFLDTCILIYAVERQDDYGQRVRDLMAQSDEVFAISDLVMMEALVGPIRRLDPELEQRYRSVFALLERMALTPEVYERAARLRGTTGLRTPDALHLATAQVHGCAELWTNDNRLASTSHGLAINILADPGA